MSIQFSSCNYKNIHKSNQQSFFYHIFRSPSERSKGCCGQFFASPPLRGLIAMVALGGVACALGGAALAASGLAGPPSTHLTVSLLMIGELIFYQVLSTRLF